MPYSVVFSPESVSQLQELEEYLAARFSSKNAEGYIRKLTAACLSLELAPHRGTKRDDLVPGIRTTGFERRASIYFRATESQVVIIGIFYAGLNFRSAAKTR